VSAHDRTPLLEIPDRPLKPVAAGPVAREVQLPEVTFGLLYKPLERLGVLD
jgi:hypothetical protein